MKPRVAALLSVLALPGCAHHARMFRPAMDVPAPPPAIVTPRPSDDARRRADEKLKTLTERLRTPAPRPPDVLLPEPVGALGTIDQSQNRSAPTVGVVVTTPPPRAARIPDTRESQQPDEQEPRRRTIAISVIVAAGLISAIKWLPRLMAR